MCVGGLFSGPKPPPVKRMEPAPPLKPAPPPTEMPTPENIRDQDDKDKVSTRKRKALEIEKTQRGVKEFGAISGSTLPDTPQGGVNTQ